MSSPQCIGIIMDGNRRFARERGLSLMEGHSAGSEKLKEVMRWAREAGIKHVIVYAFSTENWSRSKSEVLYLLRLFKRILTRELAVIKRDGFRVRCVGLLSRFSLELQKIMRNAEQETAGLPGPTLALALSYGGRAEILDAANRALKNGEKNLDEKTFRKYLWTQDLPDPDLIIRTSGEKRLSGFLPWQGVYSELFFTKTYWPALSRTEFFGILKEFGDRERRMGK
ncbi:MAG: Isoprenyl transferase [Parcubacteria group bacterium GW2011_GWA2_47_12]|nr:MAG: Isoprenyl transferase [Parcubacteria group bacterium GW2011_GWA2_47_12]